MTLKCNGCGKVYQPKPNGILIKIIINYTAAYYHVCSEKCAKELEEKSNNGKTT